MNIKTSTQEQESQVIRMNDSHFIINNTIKNTLTFYSYKTKIATYNIDSQLLTLNLDWWDYSRTTRKYFSQFINDYTALTYTSKKDFLALIKGAQ